MEERTNDRISDTAVVIALASVVGLLAYVSKTQYDNKQASEVVRKDFSILPQSQGETLRLYDRNMNGSLDMEEMRSFAEYYLFEHAKKTK